jgi:hypothetical protein
VGEDHYRFPPACGENPDIRTEALETVRGLIERVVVGLKTARSRWLSKGRWQR